MGSLNLKNRSLINQSHCYDPIRKKWVEKTPEEVIRQRLIHYMVNVLDYPDQCIAVEKELAGLVFQLKTVTPLCGRKVPKRRIDLIVFSRKFVPLILFECKAVVLSPSAIHQVMGYNAFLKAPFICIANGEKVLFGVYDHSLGKCSFKEGLPSYSQLNTNTLHFNN